MGTSSNLQWLPFYLYLDTYERISPTILYSTSVVDTFTSCQQILDQVKNISWPNEWESRLFHCVLFQNILHALVYYCRILSSEFQADLKPLKMFQAPISNKTTVAKIGKYKLKLPKLRKGMDKLPVMIGSGAVRISSKACIKMLNIQALSENYRKICLQLPKINDETQPKPDDQFLKTSLFVLKIHIFRGLNLKISRPWSLSIAAKILTSQGVEIGYTKFIPQASNG